MFLLDTDVLSALRRPEKVPLRVAAWADEVRQVELFLSAITILEIETGARLIERYDPAQGAVLRAWIDGEVLTNLRRKLTTAQHHVSAHSSGIRAAGDSQQVS
jgi:predicted nucleic acid-binding protein